MRGLTIPSEVTLVFPDSYDTEALDRHEDEVRSFIAPWLANAYPQFLGAGCYAAVYDLGNDRVVRISAYDAPDVFPVHPRINPRLDCLLIEDWRGIKELCLEIFPKVDEFLKDAYDNNAISAIYKELTEAKIRVWDLHSENIGRKSGGEWVVTDSGCLR